MTSTRPVAAPEADTFVRRHIGPSAREEREMLAALGYESLDAFIDAVVPETLRFRRPLDLGPARSEHDVLHEIREMARRNEVWRSYLGMGYHATLTPPVVQRNVLENPGWYTAYTPYQAEIAQGRLEALLNFQTMVIDLTGMEIANASLLDEATAAAEAMHMFFATRSREAQQKNINKFFVSEECFPQTIDVLKTRSAPLGIELIIGNHQQVVLDENYFGALVQYPAGYGEVYNYKSWAEAAHAKNIRVAVAADLMALVLLSPPGEWGAD